MNNKYYEKKLNKLCSKMVYLFILYFYAKGKYYDFAVGGISLSGEDAGYYYLSKIKKIEKEQDLIKRNIKNLIFTKTNYKSKSLQEKKAIDNEVLSQIEKCELLADTILRKQERKLSKCKYKKLSKEIYMGNKI